MESLWSKLAGTSTQQEKTPNEDQEENKVLLIQEETITTTTGADEEKLPVAQMNVDGNAGNEEDKDNVSGEDDLNPDDVNQSNHNEDNDDVNGDEDNEENADDNVDDNNDDNMGDNDDDIGDNDDDMGDSDDDMGDNGEGNEGNADDNEDEDEDDNGDNDEGDDGDGDNHNVNQNGYVYMESDEDDEDNNANDDHDIYLDALTDPSKYEIDDDLEREVEIFFDVEGSPSPVGHVATENVWGEQEQNLTEEKVNALEFNMLQERREIARRTTFLQHGQHVLLVTAYFRTPESDRVLFTNYWAVSISFPQRLMSSLYVKNCILTAAEVSEPNGRNVFAIKLIRTLGYVRYGQTVILELVGTDSPLYLTAGSQADSGISYSLGLTTVLNESCHFKILSGLESNADDYYPVASHAPFLIQHVQTKLFMKYNALGYVVTIFGMENCMTLQPLDYVNNMIDKMFLFKVFLDHED